MIPIYIYIHSQINNDKYHLVNFIRAFVNEIKIRLLST